MVVLSGIGLLWVSMLIPRRYLLSINYEKAKGTSVAGPLGLLLPIHRIEFWALNRFGKALRITIDTFILIGLAALWIPDLLDWIR